MEPKKSYTIAVIPGDGTGPEVVQEAVKALNALTLKEDFELRLVYFDLGGERYCDRRDLLPACWRNSRNDAILLGAIGHPEVKPGILEKGLLLSSVSARPVHQSAAGDPLSRSGYPSERQGTGRYRLRRHPGEYRRLYTGSGGFLKKGTPDEVAIQESINTRKGVERCLRYAFEFCRKRNKRKKLTLCGKTNVLTYAFDLWERVFHEVAREYPGHPDRLRPCGCHLHVDGEKSGMV